MSRSHTPDRSPSRSPSGPVRTLSDLQKPEVVVARFRSQIRSPEGADGCQVWEGGLHGDARLLYYVTAHGARRTCRPERFAWMLAHGEMPPTHRAIKRTCTTSNCIAPEHLKLGEPRIVRGEEKKRSKLTIEDVKLIRSQPQPLARGEKQKLATQFGVSHTTIYNVLAGNIWKHVE